MFKSLDYPAQLVLDPNHPDIGAWSSGLVAAPTWSGGTVTNVSASDPGTEGDIDLTWDAATQSAGFGILYKVDYRTTSGPGAWTEAFRTTATSGTVTGLTDSTSYDFRVSAITIVSTLPSTVGTDTDSATPTGTILPSVPTITSVTASGLNITVSLTGDAGATYRARVMDAADTEEDEQSRVGSGDISLTATGYGMKYIVAWGIAEGKQTEPTNIFLISLTDPSADPGTQYRVIEIERMPGTPYKRLVLERVERPITP